MTATPSLTTPSLAGHDLPSANRRHALLARVQAVTGLLVALFVGVHLLNTFAAALSYGAYDRVQAALRVVYQQPIIETLLIGAIAVHGACAVISWRRRVRSGNPAERLDGARRWHRIAGWFLLLVIAGHVLATRGPSWWLDTAPGAAGLGFSLAFAPYVFYPYYLALGGFGLYHLLHGVGVATARLGWPVRLARVRAPLTWAGSALVLLALLGLGGVLYSVPDPYANDYAQLGVRLLRTMGFGA